MYRLLLLGTGVSPTSMFSSGSPGEEFHQSTLLLPAAQGCSAQGCWALPSAVGHPSILGGIGWAEPNLREQQCFSQAGVKGRQGLLEQYEAFSSSWLPSTGSSSPSWAERRAGGSSLWAAPRGLLLSLASGPGLLLAASRSRFL